VWAVYVSQKYRPDPLREELVERINLWYMPNKKAGLDKGESSRFTLKREVFSLPIALLVLTHQTVTPMFSSTISFPPSIVPNDPQLRSPP